MPILLDAVVIYLSSIVVLTPNGQFLDCASVAFSDLCSYRVPTAFITILVVFWDNHILKLMF